MLPKVVVCAARVVYCALSVRAWGIVIDTIAEASFSCCPI